ncbi:DEAD/DEAH box helicase family protein [Alteribacter natronophilus]|uniref:DEAD/DEAH box helicase family protein n=1 Tax=Alteribacter natronophilus TaxID=2583810 RepID=UPI00110DCADC|nr:DEAD/DEAH box helicase family protein [Alteribacter natronophilus]TMW70652.1 DNA helicase [Alteribacter natronophilus]
MSGVKLITSQFADEVIGHLKQADTIYILVSFTMKTGVDLLSEGLRKAAERGADIKICTGDYLYVTQPGALRSLTAIHPNINVRLLRAKGRSFHPKAYIFNFEKQNGVLYVGSSNLSRSALTYGVEWNLSASEEAAFETFEEANEEFMKLFFDPRTVPVNEQTIAGYEKEYEQVHRDTGDHFRHWHESEQQELMFGGKTSDIQHVIDPPAEYNTEIALRPRHAQLEALEALRSTVEEDYDKSMVVMATGLGKTYLAGFFAEEYDRVLFVAHREEILYQAKKSFNHIMPEKSQGILNGNLKERQSDQVFASIFTLSREKELHRFSPYEFDLIIVDEFHHAAASSYQALLDYFKPGFLLGLTATPDRLDGKDVYNLCEGNVAYQLHFLEAIERNWLSPFRYYGVYDDTDYSSITWLGTQYDKEELAAVQMRTDLAEKIFDAWSKHKQTRTLAFCSSIKQAQFLNDYFISRGVRAVTLTSGRTVLSRPEAIRQLTSGELDIIFTVDLFNEGTDIPSVDTLLFARPTESLTVFTQQVGRGLRLHEGKENCVIIDLLGNYRNADLKLQLFDKAPSDKKKKGKEPIVPHVPESCSINLDVKAVSLLEEFRRKEQPRKHKILAAYRKLKEELGRRPSYLEFHRQAEVESKAVRDEFRSYPGFLDWAGELSGPDSEAFNSGEEWFNEVERTVMSKSYKMTVLLYMLKSGSENWKGPVTPEETAPFFREYYLEKDYRRNTDFNDKTTRDISVKKSVTLIRTMPMTKWSGSSKGLISFEENQFRIIADWPEEHNPFIYEMTKEICHYRLESYFERKAGN